MTQMTKNRQAEKKTEKETYGLNIDRIREDFPMLSKKINGRQLIYFNSAASSQKPQQVIDRLAQFYTEEYAMPNEDVQASQRTTALIKETREKLAKMFNAGDAKEIIFTKGTTDGLNLVAKGFADTLLKEGDEVLISQFEHHANIVPWQMACAKTGAQLVIAPFDENHELDMEVFEQLINARTRVISIVHCSHVLGTILPIKEITALAGKRNIPVVVDGAQAAPHMPIDVRDLGCDFYAFSGHKMGSPTGVGVLYGKQKWLDEIAPNTGGNKMAPKVSFDEAIYAGLPDKFEGGTGHFAGVVALSVLIDYVQKLGMARTAEYEVALARYASKKLNAIDGLTIYGSAADKEPVISFDIKGQDVKELEKYLDEEWSIETKAGDLSAQPLMEILGVKKLLRISFSYYNSYEEIDSFVHAVQAFLLLKNKGSRG